MKRILTLLLALTLLALTGVAETQTTAETKTPVDAQALAGDLGLSLLRETYAPGSNTILSPLSLRAALSMAALGAQGETRAQIDAWLDSAAFAQGYKTLADRLSLCGLDMTNGAFVHEEIAFSQAYSQQLSQMLVETFQLPYEQAEEAVNAWVFEHTNEKIEKLLNGQITEDTRLLLLNALTLDAKWNVPFDPSLTEEGVFHAPQGDVAAEFMHEGTMDLLYGETETGKWVRLPYDDGSLYMLVFLPDEGKMEQALDAFAQQGLAYAGEGTERVVSLTMPKLTLSSDMSLKTALGALGMGDMFTKDADFSGITGEDELFVSDIVQSVALEVGEDGTSAAAATAVIMVAKSGFIQDLVPFTVDRPFLALIADAESGETCFAACVETVE